MSIDIEVFSKERPSPELVRAAAESLGYQSESYDEASDWSLAWRKPERGRIVTEIHPFAADPVADEYELECGVPAGPRWQLNVHFSSVPYRNTLVDAYRLATGVSSRLDGVVLSDGEIVPDDYWPEEFRPGLRGLVDDLREMRRASRAAAEHDGPSL